MKKTEVLSRAVLIRLSSLGNTSHCRTLFSCENLSTLTYAMASLVSAFDWCDRRWMRCCDITIVNTSTPILSNFFSYISLSYNSGMKSDYKNFFLSTEPVKTKVLNRRLRLNRTSQQALISGTRSIVYLQKEK